MHFFVTIFCHHMQSQNYHGRKFSDFLPDFQPPIMHFFVTIVCHHMQSQNYHGRKFSDFLPDFQPPIMHFFVTIFCHHMHSQNYKLTPASSVGKLLRNYPPPRTFELLLFAIANFFFQIGYTAGYLLISPVMEKINRRTLFMTSSSLMAVALSIIASSMPNSEDLDVEVENKPLYMQMILPVSVILFSICYGAGFGPVFYTWSSELFPPRYYNWY
jgi:MFS family permease